MSFDMLKLSKMDRVAQSAVKGICSRRLLVFRRRDFYWVIRVNSPHTRSLLVWGFAMQTLCEHNVIRAVLRKYNASLIQVTFICKKAAFATKYMRVIAASHVPFLSYSVADPLCSGHLGT